MHGSSVRLFDLFGFNRKYVVMNLVWRNLKLRYRRSWLGLLWTLLIPAAQSVVFFVVFQFVMRVQIENYLLFLLSGLLPWTFFLTFLLQGMESSVANHGILSKVPIPPYTFVLSEGLTSFLNLFLSLPILIVIAFLSLDHVTPWILFTPLPLILLFLQAYGWALVLSAYFVYFRDLRHIMSIVLQIWFYLTPILYSKEMIPAGYGKLAMLNPVTPCYDLIHQVLVNSHPPSWKSLLIASIWAAFALALGWFTMRRHSSQLVEGL